MLIEEWMDNEDPLETRMFYELMQQYRHAPLSDPSKVNAAYAEVKAFLYSQMQSKNHGAGHD